MEKYQKTKNTPLCEFYKSMGHNIQGCQFMELMHENTFNVYRVQGMENT